jgi:hypothetical protein
MAHLTDRVEAIFLHVRHTTSSELPPTDRRPTTAAKSSTETVAEFDAR